MSPNMRNVSVRELWSSIKPCLGSHCGATISYIERRLRPFYESDVTAAPTLISALRRLEELAGTCRGSLTYELSNELQKFAQTLSIIPAKNGDPWMVYEDDIRSELMKVYRGKPQEEAAELVNTVIQAIRRVKQ